MISQDQLAEFAESERKDPFQRARSLPELLRFDDLDFVRCAYVTLLGRQPDLPGQAHYAGQIRAGCSKYHVLGQLRRSPEAKHHDPGIAGLDRALQRAAWQRRPLLGALSRLLRADADGQSRSDRMLRSLMNTVSLNQCHLLAIGERLSVTSAQIGPPAAPSETLVPMGTNRPSQEIDVPRTPELDHLRKKSVVGRYVGVAAP